MTMFVRWIVLVFLAVWLAGCPAVTYFELTNESPRPIVVAASSHNAAGAIGIESGLSGTTEFINTECLRVIVGQDVYTFETDFRHLPDDFVHIRMFSTVVYGRFTASHQLQMHRKGEGGEQDRVVALPSGCGGR